MQMLEQTHVLCTVLLGKVASYLQAAEHALDLSQIDWKNLITPIDYFLIMTS